MSTILKYKSRLIWARFYLNWCHIEHFQSSVARWCPWITVLKRSIIVPRRLSCVVLLPETFNNKLCNSWCFKINAERLRENIDCGFTIHCRIFKSIDYFSGDNIQFDTRLITIINKLEWLATQLFRICPHNWTWLHRYSKTFMGG